MWITSIFVFIGLVTIEGALPTNDDQSAYDCCSAAGVHVLCIGLCLKDLKELKSRSLWKIPSVCSKHETAIIKCRQPTVPKMKEIGMKRKEKNGTRCKGSPVEAIGPTGSLSGYTYNPKSKICTTYYYEGSGVTKNSYQSKKECEAQCIEEGAECQEQDDCGDDRACLDNNGRGNLCIDPCPLTEACENGARCQTIAHEAVCESNSKTDVEAKEEIVTGKQEKYLLVKLLEHGQKQPVLNDKQSRICCCDVGVCNYACCEDK